MVTMKNYLTGSLLAGALMILPACEDDGPVVALPRDVPEHNSVLDEVHKAEQRKAWRPEEQIAFIMGRVSAADRLYVSGYADQALIHIRDAVEDVHLSAGPGLEKAGYQPGFVRAAAGAIEIARPAEEAGPLLSAARDHALEVLIASSDPPDEAITFLMRLSAEAYERGVDMGRIRNMEDYQAAYGYALAARDLISALDPEGYEKLRMELELLVLMWPSAGPVENAPPPPDMQMAKQFAQIKERLSALP